MPIKTQKAQVLRLSFNISRFERDGDALIVYGPCFVNEDVGRGAKIKRSAMESATDDYMKWGAVREMHQPSAVGTAIVVEWKDDGAYLRAKIVDADAILKVEEGVYKAYSIGVTPRIMRGDWVIACEWVEVSLVDRPADPDCPIEVERMDSGSGEVAVIERASFSEYVAQYEASAMIYAAQDWLWYSIWDIRHSSAENKAALIRQTCLEFAEYIGPIVEDEGESYRSILEIVSRLQALEADTAQNDEIARLSGEVSTREVTITELRAQVATQTEEIERLNSLPARIPVKGSVPRNVVGRNETPEGGDEVDEADRLRAKYEELRTGKHGTGEQIAAEMFRIKDQLSSMREPLYK